MSVAQEEMAHAQMVILHGHQLAANHHYALALIVQRCNELRHLCDVITTAVRAKRASLTRARDLLRRLEGVKMPPELFATAAVMSLSVKSKIDVFVFVLVWRPFVGVTKVLIFWRVRWLTSSKPKKELRKPCKASTLTRRGRPLL